MNNSTLSLLDPSNPQNCNPDIPLPWIYVRTIWNFLAIVTDVLVMYLLYKRPNLLCGCFDKLYMCTFVADFMANIARVILKYFPILLCNHHFIARIEEEIPLASIVNGTEWYLSYVMICSAFFFNIDHSVLVVFPRDYPWMCNCAVKWTLVSFCWIVPVVWILPMFSDCCQSVYLTEGSSPVFEDSDVEDIYDCIDMLLETFVYLPVIFTCNCVSIFVLHYRYLESERRRNVEFLTTLKENNKLWTTNGNGTAQTLSIFPKVSEMKDSCCVGDNQTDYLRIHQKRRRKSTVLVHRRIIAEFNMSIVTLVDQIIDAVGVLLYLMFWGSNNGWINVNVERVLLAYDVSWELGTTTQPFVLMIICPQVRKSFFSFYGQVYRSTKSRISSVYWSARFVFSKLRV